MVHLRLRVSAARSAAGSLGPASASARICCDDSRNACLSPAGALRGERDQAHARAGGCRARLLGIVTQEPCPRGPEDTATGGIGMSEALASSTAVPAGRTPVIAGGTRTA